MFPTWENQADFERIRVSNAPTSGAGFACRQPFA
jgi:hypothetical protein